MTIAVFVSAPLCVLSREEYVKEYNYFSNLYSYKLYDHPYTGLLTVLTRSKM